MIESKSSATSAPSTCTSRYRTTSREDRARDLAARHFHEIAASHEQGTWSVPSCTGLEVYTVRYSYRETVAGGESCSCPDFEYRRMPCKHILATAIVSADLHRRGGRFIRPSDLEAIVELTGIPYFDLASAFTGERKNICLDVTRDAVDADPEGGPEAWGDYLRAWAKASGRGYYRPGADEEPLDELQGV